MCKFKIENPNTSEMRLSTRIVLVSVAVSIAALAIALSVYVIFVKVPTDLAHNAAEGIRRNFNVTPEVRLNETVVVQQSSPILELATVSKSLMVEDTYTHTFLGSTKVLVVRGIFTAKAGYDLKQRFLLRITTNPTKITAEFPEPKLLSLEMTRYEVVRDESGWWNYITHEEREVAVNRLQEKARQQVLASGLLHDAQTLMENQLHTLLGAHGVPVEVLMQRRK
jgi:hypothetical protein